MKLKVVITIDTDLDHPLVVDSDFEGSAAEERWAKHATYLAGEMFKNMIQSMTGRGIDEDPTEDRKGTVQ